MRILRLLTSEFAHGVRRRFGLCISNSFNDSECGPRLWVDNVFYIVTVSMHLCLNFLHRNLTNGWKLTCAQHTSVPVSITTVLSICCERSGVGEAAETARLSAKKLS